MEIYDIADAATLFPDEQSTALPANAQADSAPSAEPDWEARADHLREEEWRTVHKLLITLRRLALRTGLSKLPPRASDTARLMEAFAKLGRLCTGLSNDPEPPEEPDGLPIPPSILEAMERIYGPDRYKKPAAPSAALRPSPPGGDGSPNRLPTAQQPDNSQPSTINPQPQHP